MGAHRLAETGVDNVLRWVPFPMEEADLRNRIKNKMIRPTTIPQTLEELQIEQAIAREALRLAFAQHKALAVGLKGVQQERTISDTFEQTASGETLVSLETLSLIAYKQPIGKAALEAIRGVQSDGVLRSLIELGLIRVVGRDQNLGRAFLYGTTKRFLEHFGLRGLQDLPRAEA